MPLLLPAENASAWTGPTGNNTWLLHGRVPALIDAGVGNPAHLDALVHALNGAPLALVLITHGHIDHVSGADAIRQRWPSVRVRRFGAVDHRLRPDERIDAGDTTLRVIHTPGHSADHCCFLMEDGSGIFCGDLARLGGTIVIPGRKDGDLAAYLHSLRRIRDLRPPRLFPGHGPIIENPGDLIARYIRHREERDEQILRALAAGCRTPEQVAAHVYRAIPENLVRAAEDTVLAHLIKLRAEGRAIQEGESWRNE